MNDEVLNTGFDSPDSRDIDIFQLKPLQKNVPDYILHNKTPILNQGRTGSCTIHGTSGALFESMKDDCDILGMEYVQPYKPLDIWEIAKKKGASDSGGWWLQSAVQLIKDLGYMEGYSRVFKQGEGTFEHICSVLASGYNISTGTLFGNWRDIKITGKYSEKTTKAGHIFAIVGYDLKRRVIICRNSWSDTWGVNKGLFELEEKFINKLYTSYAILDKEDFVYVDKIKTSNFNSAIESVKIAGIYNGSRGGFTASDFEISTILKRALKTESIKRAEIANIVYDRIIRNKSILTVWNGKDGESVASDAEIATIFTRGVLRNPEAKSGLLTRDKVAYVIGRDFII